MNSFPVSMIKTNFQFFPFRYFILPFCLSICCGVAFAQKPDTIYQVHHVTQQPDYITGMEQALMLVRKKVKTPVPPRKGNVLVQFIVEKNGSVSGHKVKIPLEPAHDAEALRVIKLLKKWKPAQVAGKPVRCYVVLPVQFK